jgi:hypothetical protein
MKRNSLFNDWPGRLVAVAALSSLLTAAPRPAWAQSPPTFDGTVYEQVGEDASTLHPLPGATIQIRKLGGASSADRLEARSDEEGRVQMSIPGGPGRYQAIATMKGHRWQAIGVLVRDADEHHVAEFVLARPQPSSPRTGQAGAPYGGGGSRGGLTGPAEGGTTQPPPDTMQADGRDKPRRRPGKTDAQPTQPSTAGMKPLQGIPVQPMTGQPSGTVPSDPRSKPNRPR